MKSLVAIAGAVLVSAYLLMPRQHFDPTLPTIVVEEETGTCLLAFGPDLKNAHSCWPVVAPQHNEVTAPRGTAPLDILETPEYYLPKL